MNTDTSCLYPNTIAFITNTDLPRIIRYGAVPFGEKLPIIGEQPNKVCSFTLMELEPAGTLIVQATSQLYSQRMPALRLTGEKFFVRNRNILKWWHIAVFPSKLVSEGRVMFYVGMVDFYFVEFMSISSNSE